MFEVQEVDNILMAFPADVMNLMPKYEDIPDEFKHGHTEWNKIFANWFYCGIVIHKTVPKEDVDAEKAIKHLKAIIGSYQPKHEHKEAAVSYLLSQWFDEFEWEPNKNERLQEMKRMTAEYASGNH
jgi:hypothetical protein